MQREDLSTFSHLTLPLQAELPSGEHGLQLPPPWVLVCPEQGSCTQAGSALRCDARALRPCESLGKQQPAGGEGGGCTLPPLRRSHRSTDRAGSMSAGTWGGRGYSRGDGAQSIMNS